MYHRVKLLAAAVPLLWLGGCALGPKMEVDLSETGNSPIAQVIARHFASSDGYRKTQLSNLINDPAIVNTSHPQQALERLGLQCDAAQVCRYHASVRSKLIVQDGTVARGNQHVDTYDIRVDATTTPYQIAITLTSSRL